MKKTSIILASLVSLFFVSCDKDHFADLNTDPSKNDKADIKLSVTEAIKQMYQDDYLTWYYNNLKYIYPWSQVCAVGSSNGAEFNQMGSYGGHNIYKSMIPQLLDVRDMIEKLPVEQKDVYQAIKAMTYPIAIYTSMTVSDNTGSMVYSEAGLAPYTGLLTPKYDNQELLFAEWLKQLDQAIVDLGKNGQLSMGIQDVVYQGDYQRWIKFCNLLKLRIAARLVNVDRPKALSIASEVGKSNLYMVNLDDDFLYSRGSKYYGSTEGLGGGYGNKRLIDFMVQNFDPRVRFVFQKNSFNAEIVQGFIDAKKKLPPYVENYVDFDAAGNFAGWKAPGEPWVRYFGVPISPDETNKASNNIYFDQSNLYKLKIDDEEKSYAATSSFNNKQVQTKLNFTYPTKPKGRVIEMKDNYPGLIVVMGSAAETNLYLAEFKLLGADLPLSAQEYFNAGVDLSVRRMDELAKNNGNFYYESDPVYTNTADAQRGAIKLRENEINVLLANPAYDLSIDGLEKVYIQQYINFMSTPGDLWTTIRRSGIPKRNSQYLAYEPFTSSGTEMVIPRRFLVELPTADDLNYVNKNKSLEEQGFTGGDRSPLVLNKQRLWFDKNNPDYGNGPK